MIRLNKPESCISDYLEMGEVCDFQVILPFSLAIPYFYVQVDGKKFGIIFVSVPMKLMSLTT